MNDCGLLNFNDLHTFAFSILLGQGPQLELGEFHRDPVHVEYLADLPGLRGRSSTRLTAVHNSAFTFETAMW